MPRHTWSKDHIFVLCYFYKKYASELNDKLLSYVILDNFKRKTILLSSSEKVNKFPSISAIRRMLTRCSLLEKNINCDVSKSHYNIWHNNLYTYTETCKLVNKNIYSGYFRLLHTYDTSVKVLGPSFVNGMPLDMDNDTLFTMNFDMLSSLLNLDDLSCSNTKSHRKIELVDLYNLDKSPKIIEIYTFNVLPKNTKQANIYYITNLGKKFKYDCLKTYCQLYMDSIVQAASRACANIDEHMQDRFVIYFNNIKERIQNDNTDTIGNDEILEFIEILQPNNILQYYNPIDN
jgi:hypothetical protein